MSRRHTARELEQPPAHADAADRVVDHFEAAGVPIWYATRMPEPWQEHFWWQWGAAWADLSLDVCRRAFRNEGAKLYHVQRDKHLRDDLEDWLIVEGVQAMATYVPDPWDPEPDQRWARFLYGFLRRRAQQHFAAVVGRVQIPSGRAAADAWNRGIPSAEALDERAAETGFVVRRHALHGAPFEARNPETVIIQLEELEAQADKVERRMRAQGTYTTSSTQVGQMCLANGCDRPSIAKGLCRSHYLKQRNRTMDNCTVEGCTVAQQARGLCSTHYHEQKARAVEDGTWVPYGTKTTTCTAEGCDRPHNAKGYCHRHYQAHLRATAPLCHIEGCELRATKRDMCSTHYRRWRKARATGEGSEYPA